MSNKRIDSLSEQPSGVSRSAKARYQHNFEQAEQLLAAYQQGDAKAIAQFVDHHPLGQQPGFTPSLQDARLLVSAGSVRVKRLSLEKLKKDSKDLLKTLKASRPEAIARFKLHHPKGLPRDVITLKLADAQCVVARENGLASWAKLKHHFALIEQAHNQLQHPHLSLDHDLTTLHIRCGNDIQAALLRCGFTGEFMEISNPFPQGQVPPFDPLDNFVTLRSDFIVKHYAADIPPEYADRVSNAPDEIRRVDERLRSLPQGVERMVLWFEHDPFDQLCLAYVLAHLVDAHLGRCHFELIQVNHFPGVEKFIGLGYLSQHPENLVALWQQRVAITPAMMAFGARCWHAFTAADPTALWQLSQGPAPLPLMQQAMRRMLKELPWTTNGLSLTEQLALQIINRDGPINIARAFHFLNTESEPLSFLGDIMFLSAMRPLWQHEVAALRVTDHDAGKPPMLQDTVAITATGRKLMNGHCHWLAICDPRYERWVGNVRITPGGNNWHWCPEKDKPVLMG